MNKLFAKEIGKFLGLFIILFLIIFCALNIYGWFREISQVEENRISLVNPEQELKEQCLKTENANGIFIPKIEIKAPLALGKSQDIKDLTEDLNRGVVIYPSSKMPDQNGQTVILGHSAPAGWPKIRYDWVFSNINKLEAGDLVYVFWNGCQYNYEVRDKYFLEKGEQLPEYNAEISKSQVILISCWPPGRDIRRIAVEASPCRH